MHAKSKKYLVDAKDAASIVNSLGMLAARTIPGSTHRRIKISDVTALAAERAQIQTGANALRNAMAAAA